MTQLLFDLDGTLTDPREGIVRCLQHAVVRLGRPAPEESSLLSCIGPPLAESFAALLDTTDDDVIRAAVAAYRERFATLGMFENAVISGIPEALRLFTARGHRLHLVTIKPAPFAERILEHFALRALFDSIIGPGLDELGVGKPELVARALRGAAVEPGGSVMIGDRAEDVRAARHHGLSSIAVTWGYGSAAELDAAAPDHRVGSVDELVALVTGGTATRRRGREHRGNGALEIRPDDLRGPEVTALLREHLASMRRVTPLESVHALDLEGLRAPGITFWSAWQEGALVGCGALKELDAHHGELKSMRTVSSRLRQGVASTLLGHMLAVARERGYRRLSLETGSMDAFAPARALYARFGFRPCGPFADYVEDPNSVFMTLELDG